MNNSAAAAHLASSANYVREWLVIGHQIAANSRNHATRIHNLRPAPGVGIYFDKFPAMISLIIALSLSEKVRNQANGGDSREMTLHTFFVVLLRGFGEGNVCERQKMLQPARFVFGIFFAACCCCCPRMRNLFISNKTDSRDERASGEQKFGPFCIFFR
jgi:hypothetical protein